MTNFIEANSDKMSTSLTDQLLKETGEYVRQIYSMKTGFEPAEDVDEKGKAKKKPTLKTIWGKFNVQINDLMEELAEPLIPQDFGGDEQAAPAKNKKVKEPTCDETDLHFIRCLKPNDVKKANIFFHAMTLQQITYMGVLESIRVKQENFPYRYKYEDFYRIYELLSSEYVNGRYDLMDEGTKRSKDSEWKNYTEEIIKKAFGPLSLEEY